MTTSTGGIRTHLTSRFEPGRSSGCRTVPSPPGLLIGYGPETVPKTGRSGPEITVRGRFSCPCVPKIRWGNGPPGVSFCPERAISGPESRGNRPDPVAQGVRIHDLLPSGVTNTSGCSYEGFDSERVY